MKNILFTTLFVLGAVFNNATAQSKDDKQLTAAIDKLLSEQFKTNETGGAALVARNGEIVTKKLLEWLIWN